MPMVGEGVDVSEGSLMDDDVGTLFDGQIDHRLHLYTEEPMKGE